MPTVVDSSNSTSSEDASVMKFFELSIVRATQLFEILEQLAGISSEGSKVRLPDAQPKASCV